jgi:metal-dependent amidase/aminoacylase/carboxypeptidase family protein
MTSTAAEAAAQAVNTLSFNERLVEIRRHLHRHPELSNEEYETTEYITSLLKQAGVKIVDYGLKTGVIAEIGGLQGGPVIALRADIDALPIQEETGLSYARCIPAECMPAGMTSIRRRCLGRSIS